MCPAKLEVDVQCSWANVLALAESTNREDVEALLKSCSSVRRGSNSQQSPKSNGEKDGGNTQVNEIEILCILPLCTFLHDSGGMHADIVVPGIVGNLLSLIDLLDLAPHDPAKCQEAVCSVFVKLHSLLTLPSLGLDRIDQLSSAVNTLLMQCIAPDSQRSPGYTVCYCIVRALARDAVLTDKVPLLPQHAIGVLNWLHEKFYRDESETGTNGQNTCPTSTIPHIEDEKVLAITIPLVTATFPVGNSSTDDLNSHSSTLMGPSQIDIKQDTLLQIICVACDAMQSALQPLLESAAAGTPSSDHTSLRNASSFTRKRSSPSAMLVRSAAKLASRLVLRLWEVENKGSSSEKQGLMKLRDEVVRVVDIVIEVAESCLRATWEMGAENVLGIATYMLKESMELMSACAGFGEAMNDILSRLRSLMLSSGRLVEDQAQPEHDVASSQGSFRSRTSMRSSVGMVDCDVACSWDANSSFINQEKKDESPALAFCRMTAEALCVTMASAWQAGHKSAVKGITVPLGNTMAFSAASSTCGERQVAAMALGRLFVLVNGDPEMARLLLPLLMDGMVGTEKGTPAQIYACSVHVMATIGGVSGQFNNSWAFDQVVEQLVKLYRDPSSPVCSGLMYGAGMEGKYKGKMAEALDLLAKLVQKAPEDVRKDMRLKLLALFSNVAMDASKAGAIRDLGALLPAIAAACQGIGQSFSKVFASQNARSFRNLDAVQQSDTQLIKYFRMLWIYAALHGFANIPRASDHLWPEQWQTALGKIATSTPTLITVEGPHRSEEVLERLQAELKDRLAKTEKGSDPHYLGALIKSAVSPHGEALLIPQSAGLNAYILAVATLELSRAALGPLPSPDEMPPIASPMAYLSVVPPTSVEAPWYKAIGQTVFALYLNRLKISSGSYTESTSPENLVQLAEVLLEGLAAQSGHNEGSYPQVAELSDSLLMKLIDSCPSLVWNHHCIETLLTCLDQEEGANVILGSTEEGLVWKWLKIWIEKAASIAPARAEALIHEYLRFQAGPLYKMQLLRAGDLLEVCSTVRQKKSQMLLNGSTDFMRALSRKSYYVGRVSGFENHVENGQVPDDAMANKIVDLLEERLNDGESESDLEEWYLQAAATLLLYAESKTPHKLLKSICWVPVRRFKTDMMKLATFAWEWLATGSPSIMVSLLAEVVDAWIWTVHGKMGLFSGTDLGVDSVQDDSANACCLEGVNAHNFWLSFLLEQWELAKNEPTMSGYVSIYGRLLHHSLKEPCRISHHPAAVGARFKLLDLGLRYCEYFVQGRKESAQASMLYERVIRAGLAWFESPPAWYGRWTPSEGIEQVNAVEVFASKLQAWSVRKKESKFPGMLASVWGTGEWDQALSVQRRDLLLQLCDSEIRRLSVWARPLPNADAYFQRPTRDWQKYAQVAWAVNPRLALVLADRFPSVPTIQSELTSLVAKHAHEPAVQAVPSAAKILTSVDAFRRITMPGKLEFLKHWAPANAADALIFLSGDISKSRAVKEYAVKSLRHADPAELAFFLPQLVQSLRGDSDHLLEEFLVDAAKKSWIFCHRLMWYLRSEFKPPEDQFNPTIKRSGWKPPTETGLWGMTERVYETIVNTLMEEEKNFMVAEMDYFDKVTSISGVLKPIPKDERRSKIAEILKQIDVPRTDLYLPTNPDARVLKAIPESGTPMPSKEKMPILVQFAVQKENSNPALGYTLGRQACIFKVGDDVRQDVLALQVVKVLEDAFAKAGLDLYLCAYGVIPTGYERGIIEVVPNSKSRSALGETTDGGLYEIFQREFGAPGTKKFESARKNFIASAAGYAIASYLLQCKDRHNGNILIDSEGHLIHIDFGFILEISPGGNLKFERADFKLSHEMTQLLDPGGMRNSHFFHMFEELCIRAFLVARSVADPIIACVSLMKDSKLPCFDVGRAVDNIRARFHIDKTEHQAAAVVRDVVYKAYCNSRTDYYDKFQNYKY